jgi:hypothetical protein
MTDKERFLDEIAKKFKKEPSFKGFHGHITFNFSFGECKNYKIEQTFLANTKKSS